MTIASVVSLAEATNTNGGTTSGIDTTGANLIVVGISSFLAVTTGLSDSKGNTYAALTNSGGSGAQCRLFYVLNPTVGSGHTFTYTVSSSYAVVFARAYSGAKSSSVFDVQNGAANAAASTLATGSVTPSEDNELIVAIETAFGIATSQTIDDGFDSPDNANTASTTQGAFSQVIQTTAAAKNPTWSGGASTGRAARIATFKSEPTYNRRRRSLIALAG